MWWEIAETNIKGMPVKDTCNLLNTGLVLNSYLLQTHSFGAEFFLISLPLLGDQ